MLYSLLYPTRNYLLDQYTIKHFAKKYKFSYKVPHNDYEVDDDNDQVNVNNTNIRYKNEFYIHYESCCLDSKIYYIIETTEYNNGLFNASSILYCLYLNDYNIAINLYDEIYCACNNIGIIN